MPGANTISDNGRMNIAFMASLGGYDGERPRIPFDAAFEMFRPLCSVLGIDHNEALLKLDAARRKEWSGRASR